ncbi:energy transducer TonB [Bradyrhizobium genosp. A]|uniref:energy transducer TonB n=1 Tax=Bradyrhizobium genosp. A TaxID=83626 RepID=UPI003CEFBD9B
MTIKNYPFGDDETFAEASNPLLRFLLPSVVVMILLAGGVYWIRQLPAGPPLPGSPGSIQVRLLQMPDVTPIAVQAADPSTSRNAGTRSERPPEESKQETDDDGPPSPAAIAMAPTEPTMLPSVSATPKSVNNPLNDIAARFQQTLMRHIERFEHYPRTARHDRLGGTVQVAFVMGRDGKVLDAWIRSSSGQTVLDKEAVDALRRAEPLPGIPVELPGQLTVLLPVSFAAQ